jgi:uncharacterized protein
MGRAVCRVFAAFLMAYVGALPMALAGPYEDARAAYNSGDAATALRLLQPLAERGEARAQFNLGAISESASQDYPAAAKWYRKAADQGYALAQYNLGVMSLQGRGVARDFAEAARWFRKAAEQGNAEAQTNLGIMYDSGQGVAQDYAEAVKWYRKAADVGEPKALFAIGFKYAQGQGVPQDYVQAHKWFSLAAAHPASSKETREQAVKNRDLAVAKMTPAQIAEAEKLAQQWKPAMSTSDATR